MEIITIWEVIIAVLIGIIIYNMAMSMPNYFSLFIDSFVFFGGLGVMISDFWKTGYGMTDVLLLALIAYGILNAMKGMNEAIDVIKEKKNEKRNSDAPKRKRRRQ